MLQEGLQVHLCAHTLTISHNVSGEPNDFESMAKHTVYGLDLAQIFLAIYWQNVPNFIHMRPKCACYLSRFQRGTQECNLTYNSFYRNQNKKNSRGKKTPKALNIELYMRYF